ncbi:uncharacterized protein LOC119685651 [Teleopsis dalmanni]|uniref:uncharacterized protein LOC119685651 n=1 Tax=Teleopsis dalmanni TaxID=139649 RepID=UPI0018CD3C26|nr:uncharacterized protein LOC119685651 [Teleopsis dalmanni]
MSDINKTSNINTISDPSLYDTLKNCANLQSYESLTIEDYNDVYAPNIYDYNKMISINSSYSTSGNLSSTGSYNSEDSVGDNILEENGRISLAYENLRTIPRRIAAKFTVCKCLDLSYNNFENLSFLTFFEDLHTLILDRNYNLNVNTLPFLANLKIFWINNCNIKNLADWIQRIRMQCPNLEHLSVMGNPGTNGLFKYSALTIDSSLTDPLLPTTYVSNYQDYVQLVLPNLQYLDGVSLNVSTKEICKTIANHDNITTPSRSASKSGTGNSTNSNSCISDNKIQPSNHKSSPTLSFFFRLRKRKKSYTSSSTN